MESEALSDGLRHLPDARSEAADTELASLVDTIGAWTEEVANQANDRIRYLEQSLGSSPFSASAVYETKASINKAAADVLGEVIRDNPNHPHHETLLAGKKYFEHRHELMCKAAKDKQGKIADPRESAGTKKLTGLSRLLHPLKARAESAARERYVNAMLENIDVHPDWPGSDEVGRGHPRHQRDERGRGRARADSEEGRCRGGQCQPGGRARFPGGDRRQFRLGQDGSHRDPFAGHSRGEHTRRQRRVCKRNELVRRADPDRAQRDFTRCGVLPDV